MKISCIMTTFNEGEILRQSVASVLNQTYSNLELIIVDDGSGCETKAILGSIVDPRLKIIPQSNDGLSSARNRALAHCDGDYICFLDSDDVRAPWAFAEVAQAIKLHKAELIIVRGVFSSPATPLELFMDEINAVEADAEFTAAAATERVWSVYAELLAHPTGTDRRKGA